MKTWIVLSVVASLFPGAVLVSLAADENAVVSPAASIPARAANAPAEVAAYYFVLLTKGPKWNAKTDESRKIEEGHMANIQAMKEAGKLALAGPFTDESAWRGFYIFKAESLVEAKMLVESDPAVKGGQLAYEIHPWMTLKGELKR